MFLTGFPSSLDASSKTLLLGIAVIAFALETILSESLYYEAQKLEYDRNERSFLKDGVTCMLLKTDIPSFCRPFCIDYTR